jgi:hypothetical protein
VQIDLVGLGREVILVSRVPVANGLDAIVVARRA